ncbi:MAG: ribosomal protein S18-alanine N-acetyltransferase [Candidatus Acidiferrales bacterium]
MNIRPTENDDVDSILAIQAASPEIAQWTANDYSRVARGEMAGWVAEENQSIAGFLVARNVTGEIEILNLAVRPDARRRGIGASLLRESFAWGRAQQAQKVFLEVRASNLAALRLYERHGFQVTGRRPRYYTAPVEDALVLTAALP